MADYSKHLLFLDREIYSYNRKGYVDHSLDWQIKGGGYLDGVGFDIAPFQSGLTKLGVMQDTVIWGFEFRHE